MKKLLILGFALNFVILDSVGAQSNRRPDADADFLATLNQLNARVCSSELDGIAGQAVMDGRRVLERTDNRLVTVMEIRRMRFRMEVTCETEQRDGQLHLVRRHVFTPMR